MSSTFGIEAPGQHHQALHRQPARYLVVIDSGGSTIARLFLDTRRRPASSTPAPKRSR
jgi:hypothetical protein